MNSNDFFERRAGVLLHPTSLPSGVLDRDVERWLELMSDTGCSVWQVLPLGEPQGGLSPYQCVSAFAMNPALLPDYPRLDSNLLAFQEYCTEQSDWLVDYALFKILKQCFDDRPWNEWPDEWKHRMPEALARAHRHYADEINELSWQQYQLHLRWQAIRRNANSKGILLFGDMPLYVAYNSADVWANRERFLLDENGNMAVVSGVPPDYFSATGQRWGNPHYDWDFMREHRFAWWLERVQCHLEQFDILRIDHFRGLEAAWVINANSETAVEGEWIPMPGDELLARILETAGRLPIVAEDLGTITPAVTALRKKYHLPGMSVLQFGFDAFEDNPHKPKNIEEDRVAYTGTHDNDTTLGWFLSLPVDVQATVIKTLKVPDVILEDGSIAASAAEMVVESLTKTALMSRASLCIIPLQDCLHLGSEARMNTPGTIHDNWSWSFRWEQVTPAKVQAIHSLIIKSDRLINQHG
jgi:4-alpha-glucanotransferase